jgi:hypothetical protein
MALPGKEVGGESWWVSSIHSPSACMLLELEMCENKFLSVSVTKKSTFSFLLHQKWERETIDKKNTNPGCN